MIYEFDSLSLSDEVNDSSEDFLRVLYTFPVVNVTRDGAGIDVTFGAGDGILKYKFIKILKIQIFFSFTSLVVSL